MRSALIAGVLALGILATSSTGSAQPAAAALQQPAAQPAPPPPPPPAVKVGQAAPDFTLPYLAAGAEPGRVENKTVKLSDLRGKKNVVLAFFPAAFSPG